jgi:hypothetical protein
MTTVKHWSVDIAIVEDDAHGHTTATAVLTNGVETTSTEGTALRWLRDENVPAIGEELAVGRALAELGRQLIDRGGVHLNRPLADVVSNDWS